MATPCGLAKLPAKRLAAPPGATRYTQPPPYEATYKFPVASTVTPSGYVLAAKVVTVVTEAVEQEIFRMRLAHISATYKVLPLASTATLQGLEKFAAVPVPSDMAGPKVQGELPPAKLLTDPLTIMRMRQFPVSAT